MSEQQDEAEQQTIGRYEVFLHGQDVVMYHTSLDRTHILKRTEALMLLEWLNQHRESLSVTVKEEEVQ